MLKALVELPLQKTIHSQPGVDLGWASAVIAATSLPSPCLLILALFKV